MTNTLPTPLDMLEEISAGIIESTYLLEFIYRNSSEDPETDCAIACLICSLYQTRDKANNYISQAIKSHAGKQYSSNNLENKQ